MPASPAPLPAGSLSGLCLLLVEDNEINQQLARGILQRAGARVAVAADGQAAVAILERQPTRFDAVLMDIRMPVMDGCEAARVIRTRLGLGLPIIAMTAGTGPEERETAFRAGMDAHVAKPIDPEALVATLVARVARVAGRGAAPAAPAPEAAEPAGEVELPPPAELPGIDLRTALIRLGGDRRLWISLMGQFESSHGDSAGEARRLLAAGQAGEAAAAMHRLRGVAANLGAVEVARRAVDVESAVKDGQGAALPGLLAALEESLAALGELARRLPRPLREAAPVPGAAGLEEGLAELARLLADNNLGALARFEGLRPALEKVAASETVLALAAAVEALDFAKARILVINIGGKT